MNLIGADDSVPSCVGLLLTEAPVGLLLTEALSMNLLQLRTLSGIELCSFPHKGSLVKSFLRHQSNILILQFRENKLRGRYDVYGWNISDSTVPLYQLNFQHCPFITVNSSGTLFAVARDRSPLEVYDAITGAHSTSFLTRQQASVLAFVLMVL